MVQKYLLLAISFVKAFWILWFHFPKFSRDQKLNEIQKWSTQVLSILNVQTDVNDSDQILQLTQSPQLLIANHISWLDVLVIQSIRPCVFVAKSEVRDWPLLGAIASACGVVFVDRGSVQSAKQMVDDVGAALTHGYCVAGFPEGTSSDGRYVSLFHANIFEAAIHQQIDVQPLTLHYTDAATSMRCVEAAFIDEIGFLESLHKVVAMNSIVAGIHIGTPLSPKGHSRRTLAHLSHRYVSSQLQRLSV